LTRIVAIANGYPDNYLKYCSLIKYDCQFQKEKKRMFLMKKMIKWWFPKLQSKFPDQIWEVEIELWDCYYKVWKQPESRIQYLHIIVCHSVDLQKKFGSLTKYSNQGSESLNQVQNKYVTKLTTNGGLHKILYHKGT